MGFTPRLGAHATNVSWSAPPEARAGTLAHAGQTGARAASLPEEVLPSNGNALVVGRASAFGPQLADLKWVSRQHFAVSSIDDANFAVVDVRKERRMPLRVCAGGMVFRSSMGSFSDAQSHKTARTGCDTGTP